jgi:GTPase Era involved in 16S rRNA processing
MMPPEGGDEMAMTGLGEQVEMTAASDQGTTTAGSGQVAMTGVGEPVGMTAASDRAAVLGGGSPVTMAAGSEPVMAPGGSDQQPTTASSERVTTPGDTMSPPSDREASGTQPGWYPAPASQSAARHVSGPWPTTPSTPSAIETRRAPSPYRIAEGGQGAATPESAPQSRPAPAPALTSALEYTSASTPNPSPPPNPARPEAPIEGTLADLELPARLAALEGVLAAAEDRLPADLVATTVDVIAQVRGRARLSPDHVVAALAGSTGSGKSSLFNALIRFELSPVGVIRPTTRSGLACVWDPARAAGAAALLDRVGVDERRRTLRGSLLDGAHRQAEPELAPLVLIDLPDHDSAVRAHREETDRAAATVDLLVFVTDPQKYADAAWHERYLRALLHHGESVVVVLNKVDELAPLDARACFDDCARLLRESGLVGVPLVATSTLTGEGLAELRQLVVERVWAKQAGLLRAGADVDRCVALLTDELRPRVGAAAAGGIEHSGIEHGRAEALRQIGDSTGMAALADLVEAIYRRRASAVTGWPVRHGFMALRSKLAGAAADEYAPWAAPIAAEPAPPPVQRSDVAAAVERAVAVAAGPLPEPWARRMRHISDSCTEELAETLDATLSGTEVGPRLVPYWWTGVQVGHWMLLTAVLIGTSGAVVNGVTGGSSSLPDTSPLPFPALVAVLALVLGAALDVVAHVAAARAAVKLRTKVTTRMADRVRSAADQLLFRPLSDERERYDKALRYLDQAGGPSR